MGAVVDSGRNNAAVPLHNTNYQQTFLVRTLGGNSLHDNDDNRDVLVKWEFLNVLRANSSGAVTGNALTDRQLEPAGAESTLNSEFLLQMMIYSVAIAYDIYRKANSIER